MKVKTQVKAGWCGGGTNQINSLGGLVNILNGQSNNTGNPLSM
jgi:hypothetical protein